MYIKYILLYNYCKNYFCGTTCGQLIQVVRFFSIFCSVLWFLVFQRGPFDSIYLCVYVMKQFLCSLSSGLLWLKVWHDGKRGKRTPQLKSDSTATVPKCRHCSNLIGRERCRDARTKHAEMRFTLKSGHSTTDQNDSSSNFSCHSDLTAIQRLNWPFL